MEQNSACRIYESIPVLYSLILSPTLINGTPQHVDMKCQPQPLEKKAPKRQERIETKKKRQKSQGKNVRENNCRLLLLLYALILVKVGESL